MMLWPEANNTEALEFDAIILPFVRVWIALGVNLIGMIGNS